MSELLSVASRMLLELILNITGAVHMVMPSPQQCMVGMPTICIRIVFQHIRTLCELASYPRPSIGASV